MGKEKRKKRKRKGKTYGEWRGGGFQCHRAVRVNPRVEDGNEKKKSKEWHCDCNWDWDLNWEWLGFGK